MTQTMAALTQFAAVVVGQRLVVVGRAGGPRCGLARPRPGGPPEVFARPQTEPAAGAGPAPATPGAGRGLCAPRASRPRRRRLQAHPRVLRPAVLPVARAARH